MTSFDRNIIVHYQRALIEEYGGEFGVRDERLLNSALSAPFQTFDGVDLYPSVLDKAARLAFGLVKNHPFVDGNKRIAALAMITFLEFNSVEFKSESSDLVDFFLTVAAGKATEKDILDWLKQRISRL